MKATSVWGVIKIGHRRVTDRGRVVETVERATPMELTAIHGVDLDDCRAELHRLLDAAIDNLSGRGA